MSDSEELRKAFFPLNERLVDLTLRVFAIQTLLQERGVFLDSDVENRIAELRKIWDRRFEQVLREKSEADELEQLRRLLESHTGTIQ
jgi:hypothetical protein